MEKLLTVVGAFVVVALIVTGAAVLAAYPAMLLWGAIHSAYATVPAFGFWTALQINWLAGILFSRSAYQSSSKT